MPSVFSNARRVPAADRHVRTGLVGLGDGVEDRGALLAVPLETLALVLELRRAAHDEEAAVGQERVATAEEVVRRGDVGLEGVGRRVVDGGLEGAGGEVGAVVAGAGDQQHLAGVHERRVDRPGPATGSTRWTTCPRTRRRRAAGTRSPAAS